jgi:hypothetical protein
MAKRDLALPSQTNRWGTAQNRRGRGADCGATVAHPAVSYVGRDDARAELYAERMPSPLRLTGTVYSSLEDFRNRVGGHEESWPVTEGEAHELLLSVEPVPDCPPEDEPPEAA